jgi:hypothetical protein
MGRHSSSEVREKPVRNLRQLLRDAARWLWQLLPTGFRRRMWHRRQRWRSWWDRWHSRPRLRDWKKGQEWEASLPRDPGLWSDAWDHIGSYAVAAELRRRHAERGDLLPSRPRIEPLQEES